MSFVTPSHPVESAYWHFRINDLSEEQLLKIKNCPDVSWMVIGAIEKEDEKGEHYHCAIKFNRSRRRSYALNALLLDQTLSNTTDYYLETKYTKASINDFINYVIKNGIRYDTYHTTEDDDDTPPPPPPKMSKLELQRLRIKMAREGNEDWFLENDFDFMLGNKYAKLLLLANPQKTIADTLQGELNNFWIWGASGSYKSFIVNHIWPDRYVKVCSNEKWDGYSNTNKGHEVVHVEEVDYMDDIKVGLEGLAGLKRMADRYIFPVRMNYGNRNLMIRPKTFVITSNFSPSQILSTPDAHGKVTRGLETQLKAINRKFKVMHISEFLNYKELEIIKDPVTGYPTAVKTYDEMYDSYDLSNELDMTEFKP